MKYFADSIIHPQIARRGYRDFLEVGASYGENTDRLLESPAVRIAIVDPCLDTDLTAKYAGRDNVRVYKGLSLEMLPTISDRFDCVLLDGDHNWYTVFNELDLIHRRGLLSPGGTIFLHDVGWPYGRRDMYYQPATVPAEFVQPHAQRGIERGKVALVEQDGSNAGRYNALHSGGPRNGVLTAVEDFVAAHPGKYWLATLQEQHGLGVLYRRKGWREDAAFVVLWFKVSARKLKNRLYPWRKGIVAAGLSLATALGLRLFYASRHRR